MRSHLKTYILLLMACCHGPKLCRPTRSAAAPTPHHTEPGHTTRSCAAAAHACIWPAGVEAIAPALPAGLLHCSWRSWNPARPLQHVTALAKATCGGGWPAAAAARQWRHSLVLRPLLEAGGGRCTHDTLLSLITAPQAAVFGPQGSVTCTCTHNRGAAAPRRRAPGCYYVLFAHGPSFQA